MPVDPGDASRALDGGVSCGRRLGKKAWMAFSTASERHLPWRGGRVSMLIWPKPPELAVVRKEVAVAAPGVRKKSPS